ncbi:hypothetical protein CSAL01_11031 [Colletotrichum salicis]|uniref:Mitochondrial thiamine pyrophosphate carrier 1 n=1 Tax=Colletotrichum salicis TaxID=1209931 RepID=A0A135V6Q0_9PEZI|nr:hypothetical protein CSAL01_11031 [Colletotrichum salicis]
MSDVAPNNQRNAARPKPDPRAPPVCPTDDDETVAVRKQTRTFDYIWRSGVAGGLAGCAAKTVVAPLDRVKILFQASSPQFAKYTGSWFGVVTAMKDIRSHEGFTGLYRGHSATLLRIFPYAGIKFLAYEQIRSMLIRRQDQETPWRRLISGSLAGITSVFFTYPLERFVRTSPASQAAGTSATEAAASAVTAVAPRSGLINFYRGFAPTMLGMLPYAGMSFLTHDTAGDVLRHPKLAKWTTLPRPENLPAGKPTPLRSWAELLAGGVAGLISQTASYPLEVIRRRMQVGGAVGDGHRLRISETAAMIFRERGMQGFFVGLTIGYVKVVPMAAVAFYTYERSKIWLGI